MIIVLSGFKANLISCAESVQLFSRREELQAWRTPVSQDRFLSHPPVVMAQSSGNPFADLSPEDLPEWASAPELVNAIAEQLGDEAGQTFAQMLENLEIPDRVNVRELLQEIEDLLGDHHFDHLLHGSQRGESSAPN